MKTLCLSAITMFIAMNSISQTASTNTSKVKSIKGAPVSNTSDKSLYIDIHDLEPGKVTFADVMAAHQKDLATQSKYDVNFIKFWVDEKKGKVYCLSSARDSQSVTKTHADAHGLLPSEIFKVTDGPEAKLKEGQPFFIDVHNLGAGNVTAAAVAEAHKKDLATQKKYGVNFINYWVDTKAGTVFCLSQATDSNAVIHTHKDAHGLLPSYVLEVKQGE